MKAEWTNNDSLTTSQTTKAILVIDKPESCTSCLLGIYNKKWFCLKTLKDIDIADRYHIPSWCPLKPMPKEREINMLNQNEYEVAVNEGWNACLEALEKVQKGEDSNESNTCD